MTNTNKTQLARAADAFAAGTIKAQKGKGLMIAALVPEVAKGVTLDAVAGEGDSAVRFTFKLADYSRPVFVKGEPVKGERRAKWVAICQHYGLDSEYQPLQAAFVKCLDSALAIHHTAQGKVTAQGVAQLPVALCNGINIGKDADNLSATGKKLAEQINFGKRADKRLKGAKLFEAISSALVDCEGGEFFAGGRKPTLEQAISAWQTLAQEKGLIPTKQKRERKQDESSKPEEDSSESTRAALATVNAALAAIIDTDESPFAPTEADESVMRQIGERIAAYFAAQA